MKRTIMFILFILTAFLAWLVCGRTNPGVDLLALTWVVGGLYGSLRKSYKADIIPLGVISVATIYVLFNSGKWEWHWLDYAIVIERLLAIVTTAWSLRFLVKSKFPEELS